MSVKLAIKKEVLIEIGGYDYDVLKEICYLARSFIESERSEAAHSKQQMHDINTLIETIINA